ncbi:jg1495, partial [Pararge aegeria aegeria]
VDNNVTRHLDKVLAPDEKKKPSFDFLVLHYLGLDHIGHLEGARSPKIKPKLLEMDDVVKKIYAGMRTWDRSGILIICGDHGMRDAGGHGGATAAEVLVPLVIIKSDNFQCPHPLGPGPTVAQVDVAPTVAWLLNAPIPGDSTGRILPSLLPVDYRQHLYLLHVLAAHNAKQSLPANTEFYQQFKRAESQFAHFLSTGQESAAKIAKDFYEESLEDMSKYLTETTTDFDLFAIGIAIFVLYILTGALLCVTLYSFQQDPQRKTSVVRQHRSQASTIVAFAIIFFLISTTLLISCFISETKSRFCSFNPIWYLRTMNQTGDRWLFLPDTADWLNAPENSFYLEAHIVIGTILTFGVCLWNVRHMNNFMQMHSALTVCATACVFLYRISTNALDTRYAFLKTYDPVIIVNVFWGLLIFQVLFELATYIGMFTKCGFKPKNNRNKFTYTKPKAKSEDYFYDEMDEPWNIEEVKLNLARSLTHIMYNDMMLIIILLMRPH